VADVDPKQLPEERRDVLCPVAGIAGAPAVAHPDVQEAVRPEREVPAVVVRVRLVDGQEAHTAPRRHPVRVRPDRVAVDARVAGAVGEVDVDVGLRREVRMERETEQASFATGRDRAREVEERRRQPLAAGDDPHATGLLDDEEATAAVAGPRDEDWFVKSARDEGQAQRDVGGVERCRGRGAGSGRRAPGSWTERRQGHRARCEPRPRAALGAHGYEQDGGNRRDPADQRRAAR
jgi:hypothetical protein